MVKSKKYFLRNALLALAVLASSATFAAPRDLYEILGVAKTASSEELKKTRNKLAMDLHSDRTGGDRSAEEKLMEINYAYDILKDVRKRKLYDQYGFAGLDPRFRPPEESGTGDFSAAGVGPMYASRGNVYAPSERIVWELSKFPGTAMDDLIRQALRLMDQHIIDFRTAPYERISRPQFLQSYAQVLMDIWSRTGNWVRFSQGRGEVTEAVYMAAFLWIKQLRPAAPDLFEYNYNWGYNYVRSTAAIIQTMPDAGPMYQRLRNVLSFAERYKNQAWQRSPYDAYLKAPSECTKGLDPKRLLLGKIQI